MEEAAKPNWMHAAPRCWTLRTLLNSSRIWALYNPWAHGLNMELDLQSLFELLPVWLSLFLSLFPFIYLTGKSGSIVNTILVLKKFSESLPKVNVKF